MGRSLRAASWIFALVTILLAGAISSMGMEGDLDCGDFGSWEEAQASLGATPSDPDGLDGNNDGTACESHDYTSGTPLGPATPVALATPVFGSPVPIRDASRDLDCADFASREAAQTQLDTGPGDRYGLDHNANGLACEHHDY